MWEEAANLSPGIAAALFAYLAGLFDATDLPALRRAALAVHHVIPGSAIHFHEIDVTSGARIILSDPPEAGAPQVTAAYARLRHEHPVIACYERDGGGQPLAISDVADEAAFCSSALFTTVFRDLGVRDQLVIPVRLRRDTSRAKLCVGRSTWGFSDEEHVAAALIQRSLRVTHRSLHHRASAQIAGGVTSDLLARAGVQVCVVDRFGEIIGLDGTGAGTDPVIADAISRIARVAGSTLALERDVARAPRGDGAPVAELKLSDASGEPLSLQLLPSTDGEFWPVMLKRASSNGSLENLIARGLTQRQAEVMSLLLSGRSTAAAALELGISPRTAEKHIVLACRALGVHTRTEALVALASGADSVRV